MNSVAYVRFSVYIKNDPPIIGYWFDPDMGHTLDSGTPILEAFGGGGVAMALGRGLPRFTQDRWNLKRLRQKPPETLHIMLWTGAVPMPAMVPQHAQLC